MRSERQAASPAKGMRDTVLSRSPGRSSSSCTLGYIAKRPEIELPPQGTRGFEMPELARPLFKGLAFIGDLMFRFGGKVQGRPLLRLGTVGARTGKHRETVLGWFPDREREASWIVVASNAGSARHPAWAYNLAANPKEATVDMGGGKTRVDVELVGGSERRLIWNDVVEMAPGYRRYEEKADREMPMSRLTGRS